MLRQYFSVWFEYETSDPDGDDVIVDVKELLLKKISRKAELSTLVMQDKPIEQGDKYKYEAIYDTDIDFIEGMDKDVEDYMAEVEALGFKVDARECEPV